MMAQPLVDRQGTGVVDTHLQVRLGEFASAQMKQPLGDSASIPIFQLPAVTPEGIGRSRIGAARSRAILKTLR